MKLIKIKKADAPGESPAKTLTKNIEELLAKIRQGVNGAAIFSNVAKMNRIKKLLEDAAREAEKKF